MCAALSFNSPTRDLGLVELQAVARPAEGIGQDDVRAGIDEGALQIGDALRMIGVPQLRRIPRLQAALEQIAAGRPVREQPRPLAPSSDVSRSVMAAILAWPHLRGRRTA